MNEEERIIKGAEDYVKVYLNGKESGHSWWHIYRVRNTANYIYSVEKTGDPFIIELGALLHDVGDSKIDGFSSGPALVTDLLKGLGARNDVVDQVVHILNFISFRDSYDICSERSDELNIVQDADRLDAIGAIGIARAFSYGGSKGREIYIPGELPLAHSSGEEYRKSESSTINHFHEKLLRLKEMMNTETGYRLADERHRFMEKFLEQFFAEHEIVKQDIK
ncbi:MAG: HD domain-containing protein [Bacteroidales bacterium]